MDACRWSPACSTVRRRFGELAGRRQGIAPNVLTTRIRQLERDGLVVATPYSQRPVRLAYALSDSGRELGDAIALLSAWGARQTGDTEGPSQLVRHGTRDPPLLPDVRATGRRRRCRRSMSLGLRT